MSQQDYITNELEAAVMLTATLRAIILEQAERGDLTPAAVLVALSQVKKEATDRRYPVAQALIANMPNGTGLPFVQPVRK